MAVASHPRRLLLCGYYGEHNLGDDALLEVLLQQLPAGCSPVVTAHDQAQVQQRFGVETVPRRRLAAVLAALAGCQGLVLGGGSLLQDSTSFASLLYYAALIVAARLQAKPVVLWGQGLGPLRRRRSRLLVRGLLPLMQAIRWRDPESAALAARLGRPGHHGISRGIDSGMTVELTVELTRTTTMGPIRYGRARPSPGMASAGRLWCVGDPRPSCRARLGGRISRR